MKQLFLFLILLFFSKLAATDLIEIYGAPEQGGLLFGKLSDQIESLFYDYEKLQTDNQQFLVGFDRDEKLNHIFTFVLTDGTMLSHRFKIKKRKYEVQKITLPKSKKTYSKKPNHKLQKRIAQESRSLTNIRKLIKTNQDLLCYNNWTQPLQGRISSKFGSYRVINGVGKRPHDGLDLAVPTGTEVKAMNSAIVVLTGNYYYNGKFVLLDHGLGLSSIYIHLSEIEVALGDTVKTGNLIGKVGNSGRSTGPHLHWGVNFLGKRIDPELIYKMDDIFIKYSSEVDLITEK